MFVAAIAAGATSLGVDVHVSASSRRRPSRSSPATAFAAGIMVSASHNPADDNGLKVLDADGPEARRRDRGRARGADLAGRGAGRPGERGARPEDRRDARGSTDYRAAPDRAGRRDRGGRRCASSLDCANGSGCASAPEILAATGARSSVIHAEPDGININVALAARRRPARWPRRSSQRGADVGFALDGDADRWSPSMPRRAWSTATSCWASSRSTGSRAARCRRRPRRVGALQRRPAARSSRRPAVRSSGRPVGDKYILDAMQVSGAGLGGEKSGHVIVLEHTTSGDGIVTALEVLGVMARRARELSELAAAIPLLPPATARRQGPSQGPVGGRPVLSGRSPRPRAGSAATGRVLVRPSGTEPALRVMVEGPDDGARRSSWPTRSRRSRENV